MTRLPPTYDGAPLAGIHLVAAPAQHAVRFHNIYEGGRRRQRLIEPGSPIDAALLARLGPPRADAALIAPAYQELAARPAVEAPLTGLAVQGLLRLAGRDGTVGPHPDPFAAVSAFVDGGLYLFFSEEDTPQAEALATRLAARGATAFLTRGGQGVSSYSPAGRRDFAALPAHEIDPTGAGDCFSTAFLLRLAETSDEDEAVTYGLAAGALATTGPGLAGVPTRTAIERLIGRTAA